MLTLDDRLTVNDNDVAAEVMEGEAIIINLATGVYYSMDGSGGYLWSLVEEGRPLRAIAEALEARFGVERERAEEDVIAVAERLLEEGLVESEEAGSGNGSEAPAPEPAAEPYRSPSLEVYRDMEELLALDPPMPGLDASGWEGDGGDGTAPAEGG